MRARLVNRLAVRDLFVHGMRWVAPAKIGGFALGIPTAHVAPPSRGQVSRQPRSVRPRAQTFFADYECTGTPNCARIPQSLYYGGGISVLFAPSLPLPKPWRPFVGFDVSVLTTTFHGEQYDKGVESLLAPASYTFDSYVLSFELGVRI